MLIHFRHVNTVNPVSKEAFLKASKAGPFSDRMIHLFAKATGNYSSTDSLQSMRRLMQRIEREKAFRASPEGQALTQLEKAEASLKAKDKNLNYVELDTPEWDRAFSAFSRAQSAFNEARKNYEQIRS